jgi:uncharacterized protein YyaL (SSP411 family)
MLADMRAPEGGFFAARDADSEGEEGRFYVWTPATVAELLQADDYAIFARRFGLDSAANFEGAWHLSVRAALADIAADSNQSLADVEAAIARAREILFDHRRSRIAPQRDEKLLTSWNALAIRGLAIAGRILQRNDLIDAAAAAADFITRKLFVNDRLLASYKDGRARYPAYLDDHAFLLDALLHLLQARWSTAHLRIAVQLADSLLEYFEDRDNGGFYFTAGDHEQLMHRPKPLADESVPSGNGIAALALQRLGYLLGEGRYLSAAESALRAAWQAMTEYPNGHVSLLAALEEFLTPPEIIVLRGPAEEISRWRDDAAKLYAPSRLVFAIEEIEDDLPGALEERRPVSGETVAYRCIGTHCDLPVTSWEALAIQLCESAEKT